MRIAGAFAALAAALLGHGCGAFSPARRPAAAATTAAAADDGAGGRGKGWGGVAAGVLGAASAVLIVPGVRRSVRSHVARSRSRIWILRAERWRCLTESIRNCWRLIEQ